MPRPALSMRLRILLWLEKWSFPLWRWAVSRRLSRGKETPQSMAQKLMAHEAAKQGFLPPNTPLIWGHAVGVGEVLGLLGLFRRLSEALPGHHFLLTSSSRTSGEALARQKLPQNFHHQFAPIDHPRVLERFLEAWQPRAACWSETDLWPGMVVATMQRGIPMLMLNTRLDDAKAARIGRMRWFYVNLLDGFTRLYAQNHSSAEHLRALGLADQLAPISGNIKALAPPLHVDEDQLAMSQSVWRDRPIWVLASSHLGEEEIALQAHAQLLEAHPAALLIIVPRDAFRGKEIVSISCSLGMLTGLRSQHSGLEASWQVYVADTMGELGLWYALSDIALIGGSLVPIGGHNPYEAISLSCQVLTGPYVQNFSESYEDLIAGGWAQTVTDANEISQALALAWAQPRLNRGSRQVAGDLLQDILAQLRTRTQKSVR